MTVHIPTTVKDPDKIRTRRACIIEAAVTLFAEKGFHRATTRELAKASGLSNGALYEYVQSKEDILYLVCQHIHTEMRIRLEDSQSRHERAIDRLRDAVKAFYEVIHDMQAEVLLIYQESKCLPSNFLREVLAHEQEIAQVFERLLHAGLSDKSIALEVKDIPLVAQDIVVMGQMWAFRRWALQATSFEQFVEHQVDLIVRTCSGQWSESSKEAPASHVYQSK